MISGQRLRDYAAEVESERMDLLSKGLIKEPPIRAILRKRNEEFIKRLRRLRNEQDEEADQRG